MNKKVFSVAELTAILTSAKRGGQYVTIEGASDVKLNKFPTDGSERIRIADDFKPKHHFVAKFHFCEDYEKKMAKALGISDYNASDSNRKHIVKNALMQYISTGNYCMIYMPESYSDSGITLNGRPLTDEEVAYMNRYKSHSTSKSVVDYRTISLHNIERLAIGKEVYQLCFGQQVSVAV